MNRSGRRFFGLDTPARPVQHIVGTEWSGRKVSPSVSESDLGAEGRMGWAVNFPRCH
jgi:hypothetical protein